MIAAIGSKTAAISAVAKILLSSIIIQFVVAAEKDGNKMSVIIQAEDFINAYDTTAGNSGKGCRPPMNVDMDLTTDTGGGVNIGWIVAGEWLVYDVIIPVGGNCRVSYRVASSNGTGRIHLTKAGGSPIYGSIDVPVTGGDQNWITISHVVVLPAGKQTIGLTFKAGNFNLNWIQIDAALFGRYRLQNVWMRHLFINIEEGPVVASDIPEQYPSSHWNLAPVSGTSFFRFTNQLIPSKALTIQNGKLVAANANISVKSSHWELIQASFEPTYQLKNRQFPTQYIHIEYGFLQVGPIELFWNSMHWKLLQV